MNCTTPAEFHIIASRPGGGRAGPDIYSDDTYACTEHVGLLLGWQTDAAEPTGEIFWTVLQLETHAPVPCCFVAQARHRTAQMKAT